MVRKPYQSASIPYEDEIIALRHRRPPMSYARIADLLFQKYKLSVCRETIFRFVKVRSRGRKVYGYTRNASAEKSASALAAPQPAAPGSHPPAAAAVTAERKPAKPTFRFTPSKRYNLTRLSPEEAGARRKKLEEEGH